MRWTHGRRAGTCQHGFRRKARCAVARATWRSYTKVPPLPAGLNAQSCGEMSSASGLLALLDESEAALQSAALRGLLKVVDTHWAEVAASLSRVEAFAEDDAFAQRELAALLASKVRL